MIFNQNVLLALSRVAGTFSLIVIAAASTVDAVGDSRILNLLPAPSNSKAGKGGQSLSQGIFIAPSFCSTKCLSGEYHPDSHLLVDAIQQCDAGDSHQKWIGHQTGTLYKFEPDAAAARGYCLGVVPQGEDDSAASMCTSGAMLGLVSCDSEASKFYVTGSQLIPTLCWIGGYPSFMAVNSDCSELTLSIDGPDVTWPQTFMFLEEKFIESLGPASPTTDDDDGGSGDFGSGSSTTICNPEDPNLGGPVQEGQKCYGPHTGCCANGLYCMIAETCERTYDSGGAFCCPSGTRPDNSNRCEPDSSCNFGPPSPNPPSPPSPPAPLTPGPTWAPLPPGSWEEGCPGYWGGMSHDGGDAYDFIKTPESGNWACRPNNPIPRRIEQNSLDKFKSGGEFQTITVGSTYITVQKTFGHSLSEDMFDQKCGQCWLLRPSVVPQQQCGTFGTCTLKDSDQLNIEGFEPGKLPVLLLMTVSEYKPPGHRPEIGNNAFKNGLAAFTNENGGSCNDLQDGKWSWEYQPYVNADLGCLAL